MLYEKGVPSAVVCLVCSV